MNIGKSADEIDMASEMEMAFTEKAIAAAKLRPQHHPDFNGKDCVECEEPLPQLRLEMVRVRCVDCQTLEDKERKRNGNYFRYTS